MVYRPADASETSAPTPAATAGEWAAALHRPLGLPALSCAVGNAEGLLWSAAEGTADLELGTQAEPQQLYRIGSVSKVITATAAVKLVTRGLLELDTPIAYWLPDLPPHHRETTLQQLLTHRGGVRHYQPKDFDLTQPGGPVFNRARWSNADILAAFIDDDLVAPRGKEVSYSSWGYTLASLVIEAAAGQDFLEFIDSEIARRFAVPSLMADHAHELVPGRVRGYVGNEERQRIKVQFPDADFADSDAEWTNAPAINPAHCWAGAGLLMNMPDLASFGAALLDGPASRITPAERELLFTPLTEKCAASPPLGLGWRVDEDGKGRTRWHHAGATPGGRAAIVVYPEAGLSIALAGNCMTIPGDVLGPAAELADIFA